MIFVREKVNKKPKDPRFPIHRPQTLAIIKSGKDLAYQGAKMVVYLLLGWNLHAKNYAYGHNLFERKSKCVPSITHNLMLQAYKIIQN